MLKAFFPRASVERGVESESGYAVSVTIDGAVIAVSYQGEAIPMLYRELAVLTGNRLAWGMLTGVRPVKLAMQLSDSCAETSANPYEETVHLMQQRYFVSREKAETAVRIAGREKRMLERLSDSGVSLYVGVPFCPSVCSYCSFGSARADVWSGRMDDYVQALVRELRALAPYVRQRKLQTIYIGGGTPTTLPIEQQRRLYDEVMRLFSTEHLLEFTVEAGRPDTICRETLELLRQYPVSRISINPQTMNDETLVRVGRSHTAEDVRRVFYMARERGFDNINMDLIAGLPGEECSHMEHTLREIGDLNPDSLTVHALAIKRAAQYGQKGMSAEMSDVIGEMLHMADMFCKREHYEPYYLYRQKNIAGNFENTGYAREGYECLYNVLIMEEKQTIVAAGAKAGTKVVLARKEILKNGKATNLLRHENVKDIQSYLERVDEMIEKKGELLCR